MRFLGKELICLLTAVITSIDGNAHSSKNCTQAEKIYYGTYKFSGCHTISGSTSSMCEYEKKLLKESDPDSYKENKNCSFTLRAGPPGYSTSCDNLRFLAQVCGSHYNMCHSAQEKKLIMKMWMKQFIRKTVHYVDKFEDNSLELKNGKCNDILQEYFDIEEIQEISDMIGSPDDEFVGHPQMTGINAFSNWTIRPMGVLANANGSEMSIAESSKYLSGAKDSPTDLTLPSHWKYCSWKLTQRYGPHKDSFTVLKYRLPDFWHCDGKCNTNEGDNQAWFLGGTEINPGYIDLNDGKYKFEDYVSNLIEDNKVENITDKGIWGCYIDTLDGNNKQVDDCHKYQNFVQHCLVPVDRCLGNVAIREVVIYALVQHFKPHHCWENPVSNSNCLVSSLILCMLCILFHTLICSLY